MWKTRIVAILILILGIAIGLFVYAGQYHYVAHKQVPQWVSKHPFRLGLDLSGGTHLIYNADTSKLPAADVKSAMDVLRGLIERRVNPFGVGEQNVQIERGSLVNGGTERLIVDLPGVTNTAQAEATIGGTPLLEFKIERPNGETQAIIEAQQKGQRLTEDPFLNTELTGKYLKTAVLEFNQNTGEPSVSLVWDDQGTKIFGDLTAANIGKRIAIYLDNAPISVPVVNEAITGGKAQITGNFTAKDAKALVDRLKSGALPIPISLVSAETISASFGTRAVHDGLAAALIGFLAIAAFLLFWYRLPGLIAIISLGIYMSIMLALFKLIPVTITAAGIAGFIISIGLAVDANVLIFERLKEELRNGRTISDAVRTGFSRAWFSIRDSNTSSILTAIILFWFGTSLIKGFALTLGLGVLVSMLSAITITRLFLFSLNITKENRFTRFLFSSGVTK